MHSYGGQCFKAIIGALKLKPTYRDARKHLKIHTTGKFLESRATGKKRTLEFNSTKWNVKRFLRGML